ncbi:MAG: cytochrome P450 [Saprospiraceae bacterium]|nr:cytochrome P450 [Saprospiraceae bacterium]
MSIPAVPRWKSLLNSVRFLRNPLEVISENIARYGDTYSFHLGGVQKGIMSARPEIIQHVLQKNHRNYRKSPIHFDKLARFLGNGLLTSDGDYWLRQRRLIQPGFHRKRLEGLAAVMNDEIARFMDRLDEKTGLNPTIDMSHAMMELAFRVVARSLFSADLPEEKLIELSRDITELQAFIIRLIRQPYLEWWFQLSGKTDLHLQMAARSRSVVADIIRQRRQSDAVHDDLLQMLLDARYEDSGEGMTEEQLIDESLILFVAGHETTANALAWTWHLLSQHPEAVQGLRDEHQRVLAGRLPAFDDLPRLEYTLQVIEEAMRLYPPAWITDRVAVEDDVVDGVRIPAGAMIALSIYGVHHSEKHWDAPESFRPARFSKENKATQHPYAYLPFGGGPRLCIGNSFALMEMQLILVQMLRRFEVEAVPGQTISPQALITLRPKYGLQMKLMKIGE